MNSNIWDLLSFFRPIKIRKLFVYESLGNYFKKVLKYLLKIQFRYPLHASCKLDWQFSLSCEDVQAKILDQIEMWDVSRNKNQNQKLFCYKNI